MISKQRIIFFGARDISSIVCAIHTASIRPTRSMPRSLFDFNEQLGTNPDLLDRFELEQNRTTEIREKS